MNADQARHLAAVSPAETRGEVEAVANVKLAWGANPWQRNWISAGVSAFIRVHLRL